MNDSLVSETSAVDETKQTKAKSPLVQYPIDQIPPYEGSIGTPTTVSLARACVSCIPDDVLVSGGVSGASGTKRTSSDDESVQRASHDSTQGVTSGTDLSQSMSHASQAMLHETQTMPRANQTMQHTTQSSPHTTQSSPPLNVTLPSPSHIAGLPAPRRLPPHAARLAVDSLSSSQPRTHAGRRAAQPRRPRPATIGTPLSPLTFSTEPSCWTGSPRSPTNSTSARRPPFSPYDFPPSPTQFLLVDKFLETRDLPPANLQCLAAAALLLAAKFCDDTHPSLDGAFHRGVSSQLSPRCRCAASRCRSLSPWKWTCFGSYTSTCVSSLPSTFFSPNLPLFPPRPQRPSAHS